MNLSRPARDQPADGAGDGFDAAAKRGVNMLIWKGLSAIAAATLGAALVLALPGFSPQAEALTPLPVIKGDRLDLRTPLKDCTQQAWPYYETNCLRDRTHAANQARPVRLVTTDRLN
jgi:hypothetical protein